ncbi:hypothetical protein CJ030_MR7G009277 [Morella rubra]|uniref:Uncharacterized protein n=1 Tax=Morella rubra TaxID=262757 RepID=A0A6A1V1Y7_9ROSI|nr:hypothetical protein CJ030_MR7G009277 [Morella rubra]
MPERLSQCQQPFFMMQGEFESAGTNRVTSLGRLLDGGAEGSCALNHWLCINRGASLTTLEQNYVLLDSTLKEKIATIRKDLTATQEQMPEVKQFMTTTPAQLRMLTKQWTMWRSSWRRYLRLSD